jgi:hypothetical protein
MLGDQAGVGTRTDGTRADHGPGRYSARKRD